MPRYNAQNQSASEPAVTHPIAAALIHAGQVKLLLERAWRADVFSARKRAAIRRLCDVLVHLCIAIERVAGGEVKP
jgi:hypothetical protein